MSQDEVKTETPSPSDVEAVQQLQSSYQAIVRELGKTIVGQRRVIEEMIVAMLAGGHCLLQGVPGLAKTLMVRCLADTLGMSFNRIQFTPDLMPADITGTEVIQEEKSSGLRTFRFLEGPVFANVVLADEINRTPPKTQAALLEAMQEHQVTTGGIRHPLPHPFFVLATQNPIEQEGTYPLPEAQLDRFMFEILVDYPSEEEEFEIVCRTTTNRETALEKILNREEFLTMQSLVMRVPVADHVVKYAMQFSRLTRVFQKNGSEKSNELPEFIRKYVRWGAGPRASQFLIMGAKARALLHGRTFANTDDVRAVALPVLRHRMITNFNAEAENVSTDDLVRDLIEYIPIDGTSKSSKIQIPHLLKSVEPTSS